MPEHSAHQIGAPERGCEGIDPSRFDFVIGITEQDDGCISNCDACVSSAVHTAARFVHNRDAFVSCGCGAHHQARRVGRAIVDKDELGSFVSVGENCRDLSADGFLSIQGRDDDSDAFVTCAAVMKIRIRRGIVHDLHRVDRIEGAIDLIEVREQVELLIASEKGLGVVGNLPITAIDADDGSAEGKGKEHAV